MSIVSLSKNSLLKLKERRLYWVTTEKYIYKELLTRIYKFLNPVLVGFGLEKLGELWLKKVMSFSFS